MTVYTYGPTDMPLSRNYSTCAAAMRVATPAATTIGGAATDTKASGTTAEVGTGYGFTVATTNRITYNERVTRFGTVQLHAKVDIATGTDAVSVTIMKNGSTVVAQQTVTVASGTAQQVFLFSPVSLDVSDYLEIFVANEDAAVNVTVTVADMVVSL